ncbi:PREDICTED: peptide transporter family 1 [Drosophila arizonae]|uniref:Peptide transporter family 1 n=1 Tax=Drosophila arizonae TaxID=7263 RepID=A0ABM1PUR0_DROAR|nr:PREDICTED: peptide transporter family 1 [Drosophila arizonae]
MFRKPGEDLDLNLSSPSSDYAGSYLHSDSEVGSLRTFSGDENAGVNSARTRFQDAEFDINDTDKNDESDSLENTGNESDNELLDYPKAVAFIVTNEFCERFNYYGMRAILVLYLTRKLGYNEETATVLFHVFTMLVYVFPIGGALVADGWLGKYKTILYLSIVYSVGAMIVAIGAIPLPLMPVKIVTIAGLLMIAMGTGGIKPCVSAFGGDQFRLPDQGAELARFFSLFYFAINAGSMISTAVTPILRADVQCFGDDDCYSLAFGVPAVLMIISMGIFVAGRLRYRVRSPSGNMFFGVSSCLSSAYKGWRMNRKKSPLPHFLDYAAPSVGDQMVYDTKRLIKVLLLYIPFPAFWALSDQQGSRWTFQATHMDGDVLGYHIKPDQMQVINPLLILVFIPLFDYVVYPLLARVGITRPLQKLSIGLLFAAIGFFLSASVELYLERLEPKAAPRFPNMVHLRLYNGMPCRYDFISEHEAVAASIDSLSMWSNLELRVPRAMEVGLRAKSSSKRCPNIEGRLHLQPGQSVSYFLTKAGLREFSDGLSTVQRLNRPLLLRTLINTPSEEGPIRLRAPASSLASIQLDIGNLSALHEVALGYGELDINGKRAASFDVQKGGLYSLLVQGNARDGYEYNMLEVVPPTTLSILWQLPQIVVMTAGEIMFAVTGLEFSFTQAPRSMKSVLQACWLLSEAIGNMLVVAIAEVQLVRTQSAEFALFASLMLFNMMLFVLLARNYTYVEEPDSDSNSEPSRKVDQESDDTLPKEPSVEQQPPKEDDGVPVTYQNDYRGDVD